MHCLSFGLVLSIRVMVHLVRRWSKCSHEQHKSDFISQESYTRRATVIGENR